MEFRKKNSSYKTKQKTPLPLEGRETGFIFDVFKSSFFLDLCIFFSVSIWPHVKAAAHMRLWDCKSFFLFSFFFAENSASCYSELGNRVDDLVLGRSL